MRDAELWKPMSNDAVSCFLCQRRCYIKPDEIGFCHVRKNIGGKLFSMNWGRCAAYNVDPIEKKPFYHFMPGSQAFSFAAVGCNFRCEHCFTGDTFIALNGSVSTLENLFEKGVDEENKYGVNLRTPINERVVTAEGTFQNAVKISRHSYKGTVFSIKPAFLPSFECTPEHKVFILEENALVKRVASELKDGDYLAVPKIPIIGKKFIKISEILGNEHKKAKKGMRRALANLHSIVELHKQGATSRQIGQRFGFHPTYVRTFLAKYRKKGETMLEDEEIALVKEGGKIHFKFGKSFRINDEIPISEDLAALFGYYCAEGSTHQCKDRPNSYHLRFTLGRHEKELALEIEKRFERIFGVRLSQKYLRTTLVLSTSINILCLLFGKACGFSSYEKKVPNIICDANESAIRAFLIAYNKGDGWNKGSNHPVSMDTVSKQLAMGLCGLFLRINILPFYHEWHPLEKKIIEGREVSQSTLYYVKIYSKEMISRFDEKKFIGITRKNYRETATHFFVPVKKISKRDFDGHIYNMEVEKDHSYLANFVGVANCQNWEISQPTEIFGQVMPPEEIVRMAQAYKSQGIAYTYTEPTIFFEYAKDTAAIARKKNLYNVFVTNGYETPDTVEALTFLDASRIDLKAFTDKFYKDVCGEAHLEPVLKTIKNMHKKMHIEVITLLIPTLNDSDEEIRELSKWLKGLDADIPLHFTAYYPANRMTLPPTPVETLGRARKIAMEEGLKYVYTGNRPGDPGENTYCPKCGEKVISRVGMEMVENRLIKGNQCPVCKTKLPIVFDWKKGRKD